MDDRTLLERAARAAGLACYEYDEQTGGLVRHDLKFVDRWNPLTSDADAFRLAVKLGIYFMVVTEEGHVSAKIRNGVRMSWCVPFGTDPYAATRRAIVRAAAALAGDAEQKEESK